jgi:hypothetical protein
MPKRKNPDTSLEAYRTLDPIRVSQTMTKIAETLKVIGKGNYEQIATAAGMTEAKCWKRLIDCVRAGLIHRTEETTLTRNGKKSYLYAPGPQPAEPPKSEKSLPGKTISDYSKAILNQQSLF